MDDATIIILLTFLASLIYLVGLSHMELSVQPTTFLCLGAHAQARYTVVCLCVCMCLCVSVCV